MEEYCDRHGIAVERCGKLIVATDAGPSWQRLDELERRGRANGVPGLRRLDGRRDRGARARTPWASQRCTRRSTAIVDFRGGRRAPGGGRAWRPAARVATGCEVTGVGRHAAAAAPVAPRRERPSARHAVFCAGAWADRLAVAAGGDPDPRIVPFRGGYLRCAPSAATSCAR